jgi:hypothetical protein
MLGLLVLIVILVILLIIVLNRKDKDLVVVSAHYKEDLDWLKKSDWDVVVCDKPGAQPMNFEANPTCSLDQNRGREASVYLKYIIENYDSLPNYIAFIHGHEKDWHQSEDILELIRKAKKEEHSYISLNNRIDFKCDSLPGDIRNGQTDDLEINHPSFILLTNKWDTIFGPILKIPMPSYVRFKCCAQFIVSRDAIIRHSREEYQTLYDFVMDPDESDYYTSIAMEFIWHILFGENFDICDADPDDPLYNDCTNHTYSKLKFSI